eukprot:751038-Hanusia_phi.AAC.2
MGGRIGIRSWRQVDKEEGRLEDENKRARGERESKELRTGELDFNLIRRIGVLVNMDTKTCNLYKNGRFCPPLSVFTLAFPISVPNLLQLSSSSYSSAFLRFLGKAFGDLPDKVYPMVTLTEHFPPHSHFCNSHSTPLLLLSAPPAGSSPHPRQPGTSAEICFPPFEDELPPRRLSLPRFLLPFPLSLIRRMISKDNVKLVMRGDGYHPPLTEEKDKKSGGAKGYRNELVRQLRKGGYIDEAGKGPAGTPLLLSRNVTLELLDNEKRGIVKEKEQEKEKEKEERKKNLPWSAYKKMKKGKIKKKDDSGSDFSISSMVRSKDTEEAEERFLEPEWEKHDKGPKLKLTEARNNARRARRSLINAAKSDTIEYPMSRDKPGHRHIYTATAVHMTTSDTAQLRWNALPRAVVEVGVPGWPGAVEGERELLVVLVLLTPHPKRLEHCCY